VLIRRHMYRDVSLRRDPHRLDAPCQSEALMLKFMTGQKKFPAGRMNEGPSIGLSASLREAGFKVARLQTGTPARLKLGTIKFDNLERQNGDANPMPFSFVNDTVTNAVRF